MGIRYLNHASVLKCVHGGTVQLIPPASRSMYVEGSPVLTDRDLQMAMIVGCPQMGPGLKPCLKIASIMMGLSQEIKVDGQTPILQTLKAMTDGIAPGMVTALTDGQSKAEIIATGASIDAGAADVDTSLSWWQRLLQSQLVQGALGLLYGAVQGFTPLGFLLPSPAKHVRAFEFFRGVGQFLAGVTQIVGGIGGEGVGLVLDATGVGAAIGVPIGVASAAVVANGVTAAGAGVVTITNAMSMSGPPSGGEQQPENQPPRQPEQQAQENVGELKGRSKADIENDLQQQGYTKTSGNGGDVWTKDMGNGNTHAVRLDNAKVRTPAKGYADEVPHAHKEVVPTSQVQNGNYSPNAPGKTTLNDQGSPSTNPADTHIPIKP